MNNPTYEKLLVTAVLSLLNHINIAEGFRMGLVSKEEYIAYLNEVHDDLSKTKEAFNK